MGSILNKDVPALRPGYFSIYSLLFIYVVYCHITSKKCVWNQSNNFFFFIVLHFHEFPHHSSLFTKRVKRVICSFCQKTSNSQEKPRTVFQRMFRHPIVKLSTTKKWVWNNFELLEKREKFKRSYYNSNGIEHQTFRENRSIFLAVKNKNELVPAMFEISCTVH